MNKFLYSIIISIVFIGCKEKYPDNYTKDLPFGLSYYESKYESEKVIKPFVENKVLVPSDENSYYFEMNTKNGAKAKIKMTLKYDNDSLYSVDVREFGKLKETTKKENYENAITFFKENEIGLKSYVKGKDLSDEYEWNKGNYDIALYTEPSLIIVFEDKRISKRLSSSNIKLRMTDKDVYCKSIINPDMGIFNATVTDTKMLIIGVKPIGKPNFDILAESFLNSAIDAGLNVKGCFIVDINNSKWEDGAVIGDRIGEAFK